MGSGGRYGADSCLSCECLALLVVVLAVYLGNTAAIGAEPEIPNPLTLEKALSFADNPEPQLELARAELDSAALKLDQAQTGYQPTVYLDLVPRAADRTADNRSDIINDSFAQIRAIQPIYDFGRTRARQLSAQTDFAAQQGLWIDAKRARKIEILTRYFDVLLADIRYAVDDEEMTLAFLHYDRLRERRELFDGTAEVNVLEAETRYRELFAIRTNSQLNQQRTRLLLSSVLGLSGHRPRDLESPDLSHWLDREIPEFDDLSQLAAEGNPEILAAQKRVESADANVELAIATYRPSLYAEVELSEYERATGSRDDIRASLNLEIPLYQGSHKRLARSAAEVEVEKAQARLQLIQDNVHQQLFDLLQALEVTRLERNAAATRETYRDLYLDRSRALYEMEVRTDLGDAQAKLLEATWHSAQADFTTTVTWAKLDALLGRSIFPNDADNTQ